MEIDMPRIGAGVLAGLNAGPMNGLRNRWSATTGVDGKAGDEDTLIGAAGEQHFKVYAGGLSASLCTASLNDSK